MFEAHCVCAMNSFVSETRGHVQGRVSIWCNVFFQFDFYFNFMFEVTGQVKGSIIYMRNEELLTVLIVT